MPKTGKPGRPDLAEYRRKRSGDRSPEPLGGGAPPRPGQFVVHKHAARRLHWDLRLEMGGVLQSWAIPNGPSLDPAEKRLAVKVEEHPLEYADFEGVIPADNYGAGAMILWDKGSWESIGNPEEGLSKGKLLFDLKGYKLKGRWTLFKMKKTQKEWLLMKKPDGYAGTAEDRFAEESILSNLTVEELGAGKDPAVKIRRELKRLKTPEGIVEPAAFELMLAERKDEPFTKKGWIFELKYDGYRLLASRVEGRALLRYRRGQFVTERFPELAAALSRLPAEHFVLDGELVVLDEEGKPSFGLLQKRVQLTRRFDVEQAAVRSPATLFVFDMPGFERYDLRSLPLLQRKKVLKKFLPRAGPIRYADHIEERGEEMFEQVVAMNLEGIVGKKGESPYRGGRWADWLKIRADRTADFVIVGYTQPKGSRSGFGALHLAAWDGDKLVYAGRVGTGFNTTQLEEIRAELAPARRKKPVCTGETPTGPEQTWVEPSLACEVRYREWTEGGSLRHPVFLRLREDKPLSECVREGTDPAVIPIQPLEETPRPQPSLTNLSKVFWPEEGYTKGDLIEYYRMISSWILPYLEDRPVVLTRYPDGIEGKSFFQKDAPDFVPDWIRIETMWSEHAEREINYFICDDEPTLVYLANMGTIPLHVWSSRLASLGKPDWCILDLDPKAAPFRHVVRIARFIHTLCEEIGLPTFVKTSGSTGLHVLVPLGGQFTFEQSRMLAQLLSRVVASELSDIATTARSMAAREGRVYIDAYQNGHGKLLVSPFCVRPRAGAPVSTPLRWSEVNNRLKIGRFTIKTIARRLARDKTDPMLPVLTTSPDLLSALDRLSGRLEA